MAELLVKAIDYSHPDPDIDRAGAYKRGMVVRIEPDGFEWGSKEDLPKFHVIHVPGVDVEEIEELLNQQKEDDDGNPLPDGEVYRIRDYKLDIDKLKQSDKDKLKTKGKKEIIAADISKELKRIRDGKVFDKKPKMVTLGQFRKR